MEKRAVLKNYGLLGAMLAAMLTGGVTGWLWPAAAGTLRPLGQIFINLMFCVVVPLVFSSIAGAIAGMRSVRRAGRIMGVTVLTFVVTGILAAVLMFLLMKAFPPVLTPWQSLPTEAVGDYAAPDQLLVNFFTAEDFVGLLSRRAMPALIVFSVLLGFAANLAGGPDGPVARGLTAVTQVMMQLIRLLTYYAPVAFFAIFAGLVADYGPRIAGAYGRAMAVYYPLCFVYLFTAFPLMARLGGGRGGVGIDAAAHRPPGPDVSGDLLIGGHHPRQSGGGGGHRHQPGRGGDGHSSGCHYAHGRLVLQLRAEDRLCLGRIRAGAHMGKAAAHRGGGSAVLRGDVRRPRRRLHRGVHHLLPFLPPADGDGLPHSGGRRQSGGPARHHDQLLRGLCGLVSGVPLRGRQRLGSPAIKRDSKSTLRHRRVSVKQLILRMA